MDELKIYDFENLDVVFDNIFDTIGQSRLLSEEEANTLKAYS